MNQWKFIYPFEHEFQHRVERKKSSEYFYLKARFEPYVEHHLVERIEFPEHNLLFKDTTAKISELQASGRGFLSGSVFEGIPQSMVSIIFDAIRKTLIHHLKDGLRPTIVTLISAAHHKETNERLFFHLASMFTRSAIQKSQQMKLLVLFDPNLQKKEE